MEHMLSIKMSQSRHGYILMAPVASKQVKKKICNRLQVKSCASSYTKCLHSLLLLMGGKRRKTNTWFYLFVAQSTRKGRYPTYKKGVHLCVVNVSSLSKRVRVEENQGESYKYYCCEVQRPFQNKEVKSQDKINCLSYT